MRRTLVSLTPGASAYCECSSGGPALREWSTGLLPQFEREMLSADWKRVREGLEVQLCPSADGAEAFILCRSAERVEKERATHDRFEKRIEDGLAKIAAMASKRRQTVGEVERRVGQLLGRNTRAAGLFEAREAWRQWSRLSEGYLLRSNVTDWTPEELWRAYIQLTEAGAAFRIQKSDLQLRPVWHQERERVEAHILVFFLSYVLWKTLGQFCTRARLGEEPRKVFDEIGEIAVVDVAMPTRKGVTIRKRCVARPTPLQQIMLQRLGLRLPASLGISDLQ